MSVRRPGLTVAALAPYLLAVSGAGAVISRRAPAGADRRTIPMALVAMQVGWGVGFWEGVRELARARARQ
jgi:hypothetical protein